MTAKETPARYFEFMIVLPSCECKCCRDQMMSSCYLKQSYNGFSILQNFSEKFFVHEKTGLSAGPGISRKKVLTFSDGHLLQMRFEAVKILLVGWNCDFLDGIEDGGV
jgi:hypothetical protein